MCDARHAAVLAVVYAVAFRASIPRLKLHRSLGRILRRWLAHLQLVLGCLYRIHHSCPGDLTCNASCCGLVVVTATDKPAQRCLAHYCSPATLLAAGSIHKLPRR